MRAVLDANVLISAVLSPRGTPARLVLAWQAGAFDLVVSPPLLAEVRRALAYPKLERLVPPADAERALLVSGDVHLTSLAPRVPVRTPAEFLADLGG